MARTEGRTHFSKYSEYNTSGGLHAIVVEALGVILYFLWARGEWESCVWHKEAVWSLIKQDSGWELLFFNKNDRILDQLLFD